MKRIVLILAIVLGIFSLSNLPPVSGQSTSCGNNDTQCIEDALQLIEDSKSIPLLSISDLSFFVEKTPNQGTAQPNSLGSVAWLEWRMNFQDGTKTGTTLNIPASFSAFTAFDPSPLFSFVAVDDPLRTLIDAQVVRFTDFSNIGNNYCFDFGTGEFIQDLKVNGVTVPLLTQRTGMLDVIDPSTQISEDRGVNFFPQFIERQLESKGIFLKSGDQVVWKITANMRYTIWEGQVQDDPDSIIDRCLVTGSQAFDGYHTGMVTQMFFTWADPFELLQRPTTLQSDLDGDGIPDSIDQCDFQPERFNGFEDEDGCPDTDPEGFVQDVPDRDNDGIPDSIDQCINEPEIFNGIDDSDGCPDGATLESVFVPLGEPLVSLTPESPELVPLPTVEEVLTGEVTATDFILGQPILVEPIAVENISLMEDDPMTNLHTDIDPRGNTGETNFCNRLLEDCDQVISQAFRSFEQTTGIQLPFEPTILNLIIILAIIVVAILIARRFLRKRR